MFKLSEKMTVFCPPDFSESVYLFALEELERLLKKIGCQVSRHAVALGKYSLCLAKSQSKPTFPQVDLKKIRGDGYCLAIQREAVFILANQPRGILHGVYDLAERLGFVFVYPGEEGEWVRPVRSIPTGVFPVNPRFPYRGIYAHSLNEATAEKWLRFFAKLRLNTVGVAEKYLPIAEKLGFRCETGGHGLTNLIPRDLFKEKPEIFRMSQPEDFFGKRQADFNACLTHPETEVLVKKAYQEKLKLLPGIYALHAWPEDLPGGGWCFCSRCRALSPSDQALLSVRYLGEAAEEIGHPGRIPMLVYHDTLVPPVTLKPARRSFLLFAPRERCYGHALDDPECERNRFYLKSLQAWSEIYQGIGDGHTFEYYLDQVLFRGMYPFLPGIILRDMKVYEKYGIESHMVLQVGGVSPGPDYNLLLFAQACWKTELTEISFIKRLASSLFPQNPALFSEYLLERSDVFSKALKLCGYNPDIYLDYRWLPESISQFSLEMATSYQRCAQRLQQSGRKLFRLAARVREGQANLLPQEIARAAYESSELKLMAWQQKACNFLARYYQTGSSIARRKAVNFFSQAVAATRVSREKARAAGLPEDYYFFQCSRWLEREFNEKTKVFQLNLKE
ncbi:MAG: DUF4838 domain-containing protein [Candidatus Omnitrophica bacterium]|nr:DUF4838 domain-containing protein [Candidatus Omnitrophota bacterium]